MLLQVCSGHNISCYSRQHACRAHRPISCTNTVYGHHKPNPASIKTSRDLPKSRSQSTQVPLHQKRGSQIPEPFLQLQVQSELNQIPVDLGEKKKPKTLLCWLAFGLTASMLVQKEQNDYRIIE